MPLNKPTNGSGRGSHARTAPALFENQSGHLIAYADGELIAIDDNDENAIWLPISPQGMRLLAYRLLAKAVELEVEAAQ